MHSSSAPVQKALDPRVMGKRSIVPSSISRVENLKSEYDENLKSEYDESLHSGHDQSLSSEHDESLGPEHDEGLSPEHDESVEPEQAFSSFDGAGIFESLDQGTQSIESDIGRPTKRRKIIRHPNAKHFEMTIKPKLSQLSRQTRWHYFLHFSTEGNDSIIRKVWGQDIRIGSFEYSISRQRILDWCKGWKSKSLEKMSVSFSLLFCSLERKASNNLRIHSSTLTKNSNLLERRLGSIFQQQVTRR